MRRVLVTGGAGFVGRPAVAALAARGFEVHALGRRPPEGAHIFHAADLLDADARRAAVRAAGASHLLHLAWVTEPGRYWQSPDNLDWTAASLDLVRSFHEAGGTRAVVAGTCAEYDWTGLDPLSMVEGTAPSSPRTRGEGRDDHGTRIHPSSAPGNQSRASPTLGVGATSGSEGEGASTEEAPSETLPHLRLPARFGDGGVAEALSPTDPGLARDQQARTEVGQAQFRAGRGDVRLPRDPISVARGRLQESAPCRPATLYGAAKDGLRRVLTGYAASTGLSLAWGRLFYLHGPGEAPGRLVGDAARALLAGERFATSEGRQRRDFLHVTDAGEAFAALLDSGVEGPVNIGSGAALPVRAILETLGRLAGRTDLIAFGVRPLSPTEPACIEADIRRLTEEVGFRPRLALDEGLRATLDSYAAR